MKYFFLLLLVVAYLYVSAFYKAFKLAINDSINQSSAKVTMHINKKMHHKMKKILDEQNDTINKKIAELNTTITEGK